MIKNSKKNLSPRLKTWLYMVIPTAILVIYYFITNELSPLYHYTYSTVDVNCTLAISKAVGKGQVYFRDIFEQRGIYLYLMQIYAAWVSNFTAKNLLFLTECVNLALAWTITYKIARFKVDPYKASLYTNIIWLLLVSSPVFDLPANPEELCMCIGLYALYLTIYFNKYHTVHLSQSLILGIGMGYILNLKYSNLGITSGFFFGFGIYLLFKKQFNYFAKTALTAILGVFIGSIPAIMYFSVNNALHYYIKGYFLDNASSFNLQVIPNASLVYLISLVVVLTFALGGIIMGFSALNKDTKWILMSIIVFTFFGVYAIGRSGPNYVLPLCLIMATLFVLGNHDFITLYFKKKSTWRFIYLTWVIIVSFVTCYFTVLNGSTNTNFGLRIPRIANIKRLNTKQDNYYMSRMINHFGGGKVITFGAITNDIYAYNNEYPKNYYFDQTTMPYTRYPKSFLAQLNYLKNGEADWAVIDESAYVMPDGYSLKTLNKALKTTNDTMQLRHNLSYAMVSAPREWYNVHPDKIHNVKTQYIYDKNHHAHFVLNTTIPKVLLKNYDLVYLAFLYDRPVKATSALTTDVSLLWVKKDKVYQNPELQRYVLDIDHIGKKLPHRPHFE